MKIKRIGNHNLPLPSAATSGSAGLDLQACLLSGPVVIGSGERKVVPCGFAFGFEPHQMAFVCSRSGLAANSGIFVLNAPGVVDNSYTGEVKVILFNSSAPYEISHGDRIAQLLIRLHLPPPDLEEVAELHETERGAGGFGSTGR